MTLDTRISLHKLEVLVAVYDEGSVSRAAAQLYVAQPVVTAHIRSLESRLGAKLFARVGRGIEPTEAGHIVYSWAQEMLSRSREVSRQIEGLVDGTRGSAFIAAGMTPGTYFLPHVLIKFREIYENAQLTLTMQSPEAVLDSVRAGRADLGMVVDDGHHVDPEHLTRLYLADEDLVLVASGGDTTTPDRVKVKDLIDMPFLCSPEGGSRRDMVDELLRAHGVHRRNIVLALDHSDPLKQGVREGCGVALLFRRSVASELASGILREVELADAQLVVPLVLVYRVDKRFTPLQERLLEFIQAQFPEPAADPCDDLPDAEPELSEAGAS